MIASDDGRTPDRGTTSKREDKRKYANRYVVQSLYRHSCCFACTNLEILNIFDISVKYSASIPISMNQLGLNVKAL